MTRIRLDLAIEQRGLLPSRARARDAIKRGTVQVNGEPARKPNQQVAEADQITLNDPASAYVSRAALKLVAGLEAGNIDPNGLVCLDVGASTGGFTQVLIERGASRVFAVDVGQGQLHETLLGAPQVVSMESTNARELTNADIPDPVALLVCDISFVSITKVLEAPLALCADGASAVVLFKPQFEVGRENVGKGGIVTDQSAISMAKIEVIGFLKSNGFELIAECPSPIAGGDGNMETVLVLKKG